MPRLPAGQYETTKWPVLNISGHPWGDDGALALACSRGRVFTVGLTWSHYIDGFEQVEDTSDFYCVPSGHEWTCTGAVSDSAT
jgi:hypothetical protein